MAAFVEVKLLSLGRFLLRRDVLNRLLALSRRVITRPLLALNVTSIDVVKAGDALNGLQAGDAVVEGVQTVDEAEDEVVLRVDVEDGARDDGAEGEPVGCVRGGGCAYEDDGLDEAVGFSGGEFLEAGVYGGGAEGVPYQGDGTFALDLVDEGVG
ncbi:hypothetical protein CDD80_7551 [Ophiocordyceps camponoti-rufipedis]|uniref:Uncharacterized protein n=1 Tax=Ophiocordyceps camponoti-rufipedis TaxID=2004952 RepID=A0A2C5YI05_9HYPO|nr:hypothetical protein CDD80_7551 [Ophiocordyceps camponoti-rufipedis]